MSVVDPGCMALTVDRQPEEPLRWASWASPLNALVCSTLERPSGILSAVAPDPGGLVNDVRLGVSAMSVEQVGMRAEQRCCNSRLRGPGGRRRSVFVRRDITGLVCGRDHRAVCCR